MKKGLIHSMNSVDVTYIIPAYNEEHHLPRLLKSIEQHTPGTITYEVIVSDHGSEDSTVDIAQKHGAQVITSRGGTVGRLRNRGARIAGGSFLVFLDADVVLTDEWGKNIPAIIPQLMEAPKIVTGSICGISENPSWIEKYWFASNQHKKVVNYINSGHLITTRILFDTISGFDENLQTGEDHDFSARARANGATIINNPGLRVVHYGYPVDLKTFFHREIWHGKGDCQSWKTMMHSPVVIVSMGYSLLHFLGLASMLVFQNRTLSLGALLGIIFLCVVLSISKRHQRTLSGIAAAALLYYVYFLARSISCVKMLLNPTLTQRQRN